MQNIIVREGFLERVVWSKLNLEGGEELMQGKGKNRTGKGDGVCRGTGEGSALHHVLETQIDAKK